MVDRGLWPGPRESRASEAVAGRGWMPHPTLLKDPPRRIMKADLTTHRLVAMARSQLTYFQSHLS